MYTLDIHVLDISISICQPQSLLHTSMDIKENCWSVFVIKYFEKLKYLLSIQIHIDCRMNNILPFSSEKSKIKLISYFKIRSCTLHFRFIINFLGLVIPYSALFHTQIRFLICCIMHYISKYKIWNMCCVHAVRHATAVHANENMF